MATPRSRTGPRNRRMHRPDHALAEPVRQRLLSRLGARLTQHEYPRLGLLLIITLASVAGFLVSAGLLSAGWRMPAVRYVLATIVGYTIFVGLLWMWLGWRRGHGDFDVHFDGGSGRGSDDSGAGEVELTGDGGDAGTGVSVLDAAGDADDLIGGLALLLVGAVALASVGAAVSVVYNAPALLAEVLLDGAIATVAYRRLRVRGEAHWTTGVVRRTWKPALAILIAMTVLGIMIPVLVPGADSVGDVLGWGAA